VGDGCARTAAGQLACNEVVRPVGRHGNASIGPRNVFNRVNEELTSRSKHRFHSASHSSAVCPLATSGYRTNAGGTGTAEQWDPIPKEDRVLAICGYGCAIVGVLILNGARRGDVRIESPLLWPFGGANRFMSVSVPTMKALPERAARNRPSPLHFSNMGVSLGGWLHSTAGSSYV
jgi:hypothetical protein